MDLFGKGNSLAAAVAAAWLAPAPSDGAAPWPAAHLHPPSTTHVQMHAQMTPGTSHTSVL
eukprot:718557-Pelagomonas_calceolata.AAC.3